MIEFREFFCGYDRFEMTVILTAKSFLYDKKDDYHSESQQRALIPCPHFKMRINPLEKKGIFISKRESNHHIEAKVNHHFEEKIHPSFRKERHQSFRKERAISFQNDSFASD